MMDRELLLLHAGPADVGRTLAPAGLPTSIEGKPVHYRRKELARVGPFVHRGTGRSEVITRDRMDLWCDAFRRRLAKGIRPFVSDHHTLAPKAGDNYGYAVGLVREGDALLVDLQLIGDAALDLAARNDVSLCAVEGALDGDGERYAECLHHVALTPNPQLTNLGGFVKIAAAGAPPVDVPLFERAAAPARTRCPFDVPPSDDSLPGHAPGARYQMVSVETVGKLRNLLALGADVPDERVVELAAEYAAGQAPLLLAREKAVKRALPLHAAGGDDGGAMSESRRRELLAASPLGAEVLRHQARQ
jgi:hypothetical protein